MEEGRASATSEGAAAMRAAHLLGDPPYLFEDSFAIELTSEAYRELKAKGELRDFFLGRGLSDVQGQIVGRARWAEDALTRAMERDGVGQYVLVGAGLDSFVLRHPDWLDRVRVFELDHPDTQASKRAQLERLGFEGHEHVHFVPIDFERDDTAASLRAAGLSKQVPSFFCWLGVVTYLTEEAIFATLDGLRACAAPGSHVVFDYPEHPSLIPEDERALYTQIKRDSVALGEARRATHDPRELRAAVEERGFELVEDLSCADHEARYFAGRSDGLRPFRPIHLAHYRVR